MSEEPGAAARRRELTELLLRGRGVRPQEGVVPVPRKGPLRASLAQERMWFWDRVTWPRSFLHNVPLSARLRGPLDEAALRSAFETLVARQESLRTSFLLDGRVVMLHIQDHLDLRLELVDLSALPDPWAESERLCLEEAQELFDITRAPLIRAALVRLAEDDHVLFVGAHHIVWDGWSTGLLVYEIATHYRHALGLAEPLRDLPAQYADWAAWQHRYLSGDRLAYHSDFWRNELAGARTVHLAPATRPPEGRVTDRGVTQPYSISPDLTRALKDLGRKEDATLFMVLLAGLTAVLHGLSGEDDVTVGGLIANRTTSQIEGLIGYFVNTVPMRSRLPHDRPFLDHLRCIRAVALAAFEHQDLPIGRIARSVADRRPQGWDEPLYSIDLMLQTVERPDPDFGNLRVEIPDFNTRTADYDMGCILWQRKSDLSKVEGLECWWEYKTDLFDERAIRTLIRRFISTLEVVARDPSTPMMELPVLEEGERDRAIVSGGSGADSPEDPVDAITRHARESGAAAALGATDGTTLSYEALYAAIEETALRLASHGVGPANVVAMTGVSQQSALVAACAALSRGAGFWLADTEHALEVGATVLDERRVVRVAGVDLDIEGPRDHEREEDPALFPADSAQVVLDADGSGRLTAVVVSHRSLRLGVENARNALSLERRDVVLHDGPPLREAQAWLLLAPLAAGAELRMAADQAVQGPSALVDLLSRGPISVVHTIPSRLHVLLDACRERRPPKLRAVVTTGDRVSRDVVRRWEDELPGVELYSAYTPPGCAGPVMMQPLSPLTFATASWNPVGLPRPGHAVYLLDARGRPVAPGAAGRLFVGGDAMASGFLGDPRLTAARFVPDPFSPRPGARMFATGARARRRHDGLIECFDVHPGAVQVDSRFVRPDQVDAALVRHPQVRRSLTLPIRGPDDGWRLVSYVVAVDQSTASADAALAECWGELHDAGATADDTVTASWTARPEDRVLEVGSETSEMHSTTAERLSAVADLSELPHEHYDLVVLHAVTHCLPSRAHLSRVLSDAVERVRTGGRVVVAGVRHLALRRAFHCVRELAAADSDMLFSPVREQVYRAFRHDPELAVDPSYIVRVARELPRVTGVLVQPHRGASSALEAPFLFDVSIEVHRSDTPRPTGVTERVWTHDSSLSWLENLLAEKPPLLVVRRVPDRRVLDALAVERGFDETVPGATVGDLRRATTWSGEAIHPDALASLARRDGYTTVMALDPRSPGTFTAAMSCGAEDLHVPLMNAIEAEGEAPAEPPTNVPAVVAQRWAVVRSLREWLRSSVPAALHPALIIAVDDITELPDGEPNTFELPMPGQAAGRRGADGRLERALAEVWGDATQVLGVGAHDRFVEDLGAHPLLAGSLAADLRQAGHRGVSAEDVRRASTVAAMAAWIRSRGEGGDDVG